MKTIKFLAATLAVAALLFSQTAQAGEKPDNLGRTWITDDVTAKTPGAGSGEGSLVGLSTDSLAAYERHMFDLSFGVDVTGTSGDDSAVTEQAKTGVTVFWYPASWMKLGPRMAWAPGDNKEIDFQIPLQFVLFPDPFSTYIFKFGFTPFTYTVLTGENNTPQSSAFSFDPAASFLVEIPKGSYSIDFGMGLSYPFSIQGISDSDLNSAVEKAVLGVGVAFNMRLR